MENIIIECVSQRVTLRRIGRIVLGVLLIYFVKIHLAVGNTPYSEQYSIRQYYVDNNSINHLTTWMEMDNRGYLWISTWNSIFRFNGYEFHQWFTGTSSDVHVNLKPVIQIHNDPEPILWMISPSQLTRYDYERETIESVFSISPETRPIINNRIVGMENTDGEFLWMVLPYSLIRFDKRTYEYKEYALPQILMGISYITIDPEGMIWLGSWSDGIFWFDRSTQTTHPHPQYNEKNGDSILSMSISQDGSLWLGTWAFGVARLNLKTLQYKLYHHNTADPYSLPGNIVSAICAGQSHEIVEELSR